MIDLAGRLAGLRREAGVSNRVGAAAPRANSADLDALRKLAGLRQRLGQPNRVLAHDRMVPGEEIEAGLRYLEERFAWPSAGEYLDLSYIAAEPVARGRFMHFDTETTGLAGGTGTRAFMIGAADWVDDHLRVRQLYLTAMGGEAAMLRTFASWLRKDTVLVSYNGKSYDSPLLATRYRLARQDNPLAGLFHVDLLHPMRRRYRHVWENCRLATAERQLLKVVREDDLPGAEAPRAWLTYLRGGSSADLVRVAAHNLQDLRSLAGLLVTAHGWTQGA